jgi:hypothetical protein
MAGFCEHGNESSDPLNVGEFLCQLISYKISIMELVITVQIVRI